MKENRIARTQIMNKSAHAGEERIARKRTKLITTLGPVSSNKETIAKFVKGGMSTVRLNFSHGNTETRLKTMSIVREVSQELQLPISIMLDTKGPEIRLGKMKDGMQPIKANSLISIHCGEEAFNNHLGTSTDVSVSYDMHKDVKVGDQILIDDGKLTTHVQEVKGNIVIVKCVNDHKLKTNKRLNLPGIDFSLPFLSEQDKKDIVFGIKNGIDYIAASFVNSAKNVHEVRKILKEHNAEKIQIIPKIESVLGVKNIEKIIEAADGIMVARGDLGLEIPYQDVPYWEKHIIRSCRNKGKPVIVATQMLDSMEVSPHPTRAEVTDVYYAVELGADCTMLSGESASGKFPVEAVETMSTISLRAEKEFYNKLYYPIMLKEISKIVEKSPRSKIAKNLANLAKNGEYRFIVVFSHSGELLKTVSRFRPNAAVIGLCAQLGSYNCFGIWSSVSMVHSCSLVYEKAESNHEVVRDILAPYSPNKGDKYIVARGDEYWKYTY